MWLISSAGQEKACINEIITAFPHPLQVTDFVCPFIPTSVDLHLATLRDALFNILLWIPYNRLHREASRALKAFDIFITLECTKKIVKKNKLFKGMPCIILSKTKLCTFNKKGGNRKLLSMYFFQTDWRSFLWKEDPNKENYSLILLTNGTK